MSVDFYNLTLGVVFKSYLIKMIFTHIQQYSKVKQTEGNFHDISISWLNEVVFYCLPYFIGYKKQSNTCRFLKNTSFGFPMETKLLLLYFIKPVMRTSCQITVTENNIAYEVTKVLKRRK